VGDDTVRSVIADEMRCDAVGMLLTLAPEHSPDFGRELGHCLRRRSRVFAQLPTLRQTQPVREVGVWLACGVCVCACVRVAW
jgi:hypothetical protein